MTIAAAFGAGVFVVFAILLGLLGGGPLAIVLAVAIAGAWVTVAWFHGADAVLDLCEVEAADPEVNARLFNVTNGLCAAMGVPLPDLYIVDDPALNALATGRDSRHAAVVVTQGLLDATTLVELEAVVALQLYRIRTGEILPNTFIIPTFGAVTVLSEVADKYEWLQRLLALPTPLVSRVMAAVHPSRMDIDTDIAAVELTRYPPALATALQKMSGKSALAAAAPVTAHLWVAPPLSVAQKAVAANIHAPLAERIAVLQEL